MEDKKDLSELNEAIASDTTGNIALADPKDNKTIKKIIDKLNNDINNFYYQIDMANIIKRNLKDADDKIQSAQKKLESKKGKKLTKNITDGATNINYGTLFENYNSFLEYTYIDNCKKSFSLPRPFASKTENMKDEDLKQLAQSMRNFATYCQNKIDATNTLLNAYTKLYKSNAANEAEQIKAAKAEKAAEQAKRAADEATKKAEEKAKNAATEAKNAAERLEAAKTNYAKQNNAIGGIQLYNADSFKSALMEIQKRNLTLKNHQNNNNNSQNS